MVLAKRRILEIILLLVCIQSQIEEQQVKNFHFRNKLNFIVLL